MRRMAQLERSGEGTLGLARRSTRLGRAALVLLIGLACTLALAIPACKSTAASSNDTCSLNSDCSNGLTCALGQCRPPCSTASDCPVTGSSCIDDGRSAVCETPKEKNTPCANEAQCSVPLACASDYRCRNLCANDADCNVLGIAGRVCARDANGVDYCADPAEVANGVLVTSPPPGAPSAPVV
jgi:hypothetical protein